jgi:hypothetical protein
MTELRCPICDADREPAFSAVVLGHYEARYLKCRHCGFLGVDRPAWLPEAYESPIASVDTGILERTYHLQPRLVSLLRMVFPRGAVFADVGAGYGVLVRAMRDAGLDFRWSDPFCPNLLARGFELGSERCAAVTAIEALEHTVDPVAFLSETLGRTEASVAVISTELLPCPVPDSTWWYYSLASGQHVSFFERKTLDAVAERLGMQVFSRHTFHVLHDGRVAQWQFTVASTRLARLAAAFFRCSMSSLTTLDSDTVERKSAAS